MLKFDANGIVYECSKCGASGCKLWREYNTFLSHQDLYCAPCAGKEEGKDISDIDADGMRRWDVFPDSTARTDQIGGLIPAVSTAENDTFWGYTSVPDDRVAWWKALPTLPAKKGD